MENKDKMKKLLTMAEFETVKKQLKVICSITNEADIQTLGDDIMSGMDCLNYNVKMLYISLLKEIFELNLDADELSKKIDYIEKSLVPSIIERLDSIEAKIDKLRDKI